MKSADEYIVGVLSKYHVETGPACPQIRAAEKLLPTIRGWAGETLAGTSFVGSFASGTAIAGSSSVDLLILLSPRTRGTLAELHDNLFAYLDSKSLGPRAGKDFMNLTYARCTIDLLLARNPDNDSTMQTLYFSSTGSSVETNLHARTAYTVRSGRFNEIRAMKIWRNCFRLNFPSLCLELAVLDALRNRREENLSNHLLYILEYLSEYFIDARITDPAGGANIVSDQMNLEEKRAIAETAHASRAQANWENILW